MPESDLGEGGACNGFASARLARLDEHNRVVRLRSPRSLSLPGSPAADACLPLSFAGIVLCKRNHEPRRNPERVTTALAKGKVRRSTLYEPPLRLSQSTSVAGPVPMCNRKLEHGRLRRADRCS